MSTGKSAKAVLLSDFRIFETEQLLADLRSRLGSRQEKIIARLKADVYLQLQLQPYFGRNIKKLKGYRPETWRYRIGVYRFFYEIDDSRKIVFMIAADTRQGIN